MPRVNSREDKVTQHELDLRELARAKAFVKNIADKRQIATLQHESGGVISTTNPDKWKNKQK